MLPDSACRKARIVARACSDMGLKPIWDESRLSESQYVQVSDTDAFGFWVTVKIRFSDHPLPDLYLDDSRMFDVAYTYGHHEVNGDCYQAIAWIASVYARVLPGWVIDKITA